MNIIEITDDLEKQRAARLVLEDLPDWFGNIPAREEHILNSAGKPFFCAYQQEEPIGFLYLKETSNATMELAVMGVLKEHHRKGIGRALFECAKESARKKGFSFLQVKTVRMGMYEEYDATNRFYLSLGFKEFEVFPMFWDERNPCRVYIMAL